MNSKAIDQRALALGHDKSVARKDPSLPGVNLCFYLQTLAGWAQTSLERQKWVWREGRMMIASASCQRRLLNLNPHLSQPFILVLGVTQALPCICKDGLISGGQCCVTQRPGGNMPRAVCPPLSCYVALERYSTLAL